MPDEFRRSATPADRRETVSFAIDADILAWMRVEFTDWPAQVNGLLRDFYDTSLNREAACDPDGFEPGETFVEQPSLLDLEYA